MIGVDVPCTAHLAVSGSGRQIGLRRRGWFPGCFVSVPRSIGIEPNEGGWAWCMIAWVMRVVVWNMGFCHE